MFFFCIAEVQPTLSKGSARRAQNKTNSFVFLCRAAAYLKIGMLKLLFQCGSRGCIKIVKDAGKGQRSCPFSHFDTPSTIWPCKLFDIKRFIRHNYQDAIICRLYKAPPGDTFR